jgi:hypothetical protein
MRSVPVQYRKVAEEIMPVQYRKVDEKGTCPV